MQMATSGRERHVHTVATLIVYEQDVCFVLLEPGLAWHDSRHDGPQLPNTSRGYVDAQREATSVLSGSWAVRK